MKIKLIFTLIALVMLAGTSTASIETVDTLGYYDGVGKEMGYYSSISLNTTSGYPAIAYWGGYDCACLKYAEYNGSGWTSETVKSRLYDSVMPSLKFKVGVAHIAFYGQTNLYYANRSGGTWAIQLVNETYRGNNFEGQYPNLFFNSTGIPHIGYANHRYEGYYGIGYSYLSGSSWISNTYNEQYIYAAPFAQTIIQPFEDISFLLNGSNPEFIYINKANKTLDRTWYDGSSWSSEMLFTDARMGTGFGMNGTMKHVVYSNGTAILYSWTTGTTWTNETVDIADAYWYPKLSLDSSNNSWVVYQDISNRNLKVAKRDGSTGTWTYGTVDSGRDVGWNPSIEINGSSSVVNVSYYDRTNHSLKFSNISAVPSNIGRNTSSQTGTLYTAGTDMIIDNASVWNNCNLDLTNNISISSGGSLTLDNCVVRTENNTWILVNTSGTLILKNGTIFNSYATYENGGGIFAGNWNAIHSFMASINGGVYHISNSSFLNIVDIQRYQTTGTSYINNSYFALSHHGNLQSGTGGMINSYSANTNTDAYYDNNHFTDLDGVYLMRYSKNITLRNNTFKGIKMGLYTFAVGTNPPVNISAIDGIYDAFVDYQSNDWGISSNIYGTRYFYSKGNRHINGRSGEILNQGNWYGIVENITTYMPDNIEARGGTTGFNMNFDNSYIILRNLYSERMTSTCLSDYNTSNTNNLFYNITVNISLNCGIKSPQQNSTYIDMNLTGGGLSVTGYGIDLRASGSPMNHTFSNHNNTYANITLDNFSTGIYVDAGFDLTFIDIFVNRATTGLNMTAGTNFSNLKFINTNLENKGVTFNDNNNFTPYYYVDVQVLYANSTPCNGCIVNITNEVDNVNYPALTRNGSATFVSTTTDSTGHIKLPTSYSRNNIQFSPEISYTNGNLNFLTSNWYDWKTISDNNSDTPILLDYVYDGITKTNMTYTINATISNNSGSVTGINPNSTWYRSAPNIAQNKIIITLSSPTTPSTPQSAYKTSTCQSTLGWGEVGSALLIVLIIAMAGGLAIGFLTGTLKMDTFPIQEFTLTLVAVVVIGSIGVAIIDPIVTVVGCP